MDLVHHRVGYRHYKSCGKIDSVPDLKIEKMKNVK